MAMATRVDEQALALSDLEWKVVRLALREAGGESASAEPGALRQRLAGLWAALTGADVRRPLADPRLEALRRFVCTARGRHDAGDIGRRLLGMGFSAHQLETVRLLARA